MNARYAVVPTATNPATPAAIARNLSTELIALTAGAAAAGAIGRCCCGADVAPGRKAAGAAAAERGAAGAAAGAADDGAIVGTPVGPPGGRVGSLIVGAAEGFGG